MEYGFASDKHRLFPPMVVASIVNVCNQRCVHCYFSTYAREPGYKPNHMAWDIWTKIVDEMAAHPWSILNLGTDGEPLLHPRFVDMMRYARERGISPINLTTNGTLLTESLAEVLLADNLVDVINVSVDALSREKYDHIRGWGHDRVYENMERLIALRNATAAPTRIQVNIINQPEVRDELDDFVRFWEPKVDQVLVRIYYDATHVTRRHRRQHHRQAASIRGRGALAVPAVLAPLQHR